MPICRACDQPITTWQQWFGEECPKDPKTCHRLPWEEIKTLPGWKKRREIVSVKEET